MEQFPGWQEVERRRRRLEITASIGVVMFPYHGDDPDALLQAASATMHFAQKAKRGYRIYSENMVHDADDRVSGVEALVRWQHPTNGLLSPEQFIPLAEQTGLIKPLTNWALNTALRQYREWRLAGVGLPMSVKVPTACIQDPEFPGQMAKCLNDFDVPASKFEIEIKETAVISDPAQAIECIRRLHAMGFQIAIGDFGTGHSSMAYLTELLVANIKIDKSLIKDMAANHGGKMVVRTTAKLGHTLGLKVVAKGVENQGSWDTLKGFGCDSAQGYYMSRPLSPVEFMDWLHTSQWGMPARSA